MSTDHFDEAFSDYERRIIDKIDECGCFIPLVFDPDGLEPTFAYSVGFPHSVKQGEVIVFGLSNDLLTWMINETMRQCRDEGLVLGDGVRVTGLLSDFDVIVRSVHPSNIQTEYLNSAMWHHMGRFGEPLNEVFQLVWPSSATGLFPWDKGCHTDVIDLQPALYEPRLNS